MIRPILLLLSAAVLLPGCGKIGPLEPAPGATLPVQTYGQTGIVDPLALLEPSTQARPSRNDELLERSDPRALDPFDLPPAGRRAQDVADPDNPTTAPPPEG